MTPWMCVGTAGAAMLAYVYALYPLLVGLLGAFRRGLPEGPGANPSPIQQVPARLTAIVTVAGEWDALVQTLHALAVSGRRPDEVIIAIDGPQPGPDARLAIESAHPGAILAVTDGGGKTRAQEQAIERATGELLALLDAGASPQPAALGALEAALREPSLGVGAATLVYNGQGPECWYAWFETRLRSWESNAGGALGVHGALSMRRRADHIRLPAHAIADLVEPLMIHVVRGKSTRVVPDAQVREPCPWEGATWTRKRRITIRAISSMAILVPALDAFHRPVLAWMFVSHKILRWLTWLWVAMAVAGLAGAIRAHPPAVLAGASAVSPILALVALIATPAVAVVVARLWPSSLLSLPGYAVEVLGAQAAGMLAGLRGRTMSAWHPSALDRGGRSEQGQGD